MAILTELPPSAAEKLLAAYGLQLVSLTPLAAGSVNSNFFVEVEEDGVRRSLFARIYEEQADSGARFELTLNERLDAAGIAVARPLRTSSNEQFVSFAGKPFAVYERLGGEVLCQKRVSTAACRSVGESLARVHVADLGDLKLAPSRFGFEQIMERLDTVEAAGRPSLMPAVTQLRQWVEELRSARDTTLPQGLIHGDLFRDNVLTEQGQVSGLLDFESASLGSYVYDLMVTMLAWCFGDELEEALVRAMVEGYVSVRPLSAQELNAMVSEGSVACVRFATTRLTDFSLRVADGEKPGRDYNRFFQRRQALLDGVLSRALSSLSLP